MGQRELNPKLKELYDNGIDVYSISKIDSINGCKYSAYCSYIERVQNKKPNIYSMLGTKVHDTLEEIVNGKATEDDLLPSIMDELDDMDMLGIKFPKIKGEDIVRDGYIKNMTHFATTYKSPKGKNLKTEQFFLMKTDDGNFLQGYIDLIKENSDGSLNVYDYKTSSMYKPEEIKAHGRQLLVYASGLRQQGFKVKHVGWIFLKYVTVKFEGYKTSRSKKKEKLQKCIERKKIAKEMEKYVVRDMEDNGFDEFEISAYMDKFKETNKFDSLPNIISKNYKMIPYVLEYDLDDENIKECFNYIDNTVKEWKKLRGKGYPQDYPPRSFVKTQKDGKEVEDTFFCYNLCEYSRICPHFLAYVESKQIKNDDNDEDFFS